MNTLKQFTYINCITCGVKIELLDLKSFQDIKEYYEHYKGVNPESLMWKNGMVGQISAGYGSTVDGDVYYLGMCDKCVDKNVKNLRLRYVGDHLVGASKYTDKELEEMEKLRNRNNNLNDLLD